MFYNIKRFKETTKLSLYMDSNNHITPNDLKFYEDITPTKKNNETRLL